MKLLNNICWIEETHILIWKQANGHQTTLSETSLIDEDSRKVATKDKSWIQFGLFDGQERWKHKVPDKRKEMMVPTLYQLRVDSHCAHHLIQLKRGQNEIEFKGICVGRADGWMEGGGYWLRAWAAVDDKWPTKTKTSQLWREKNDQQSFKLHRKKVTRILKHPLFALGSEMTIPPGFKTYMSWTNTI